MIVSVFKINSFVFYISYYDNSKSSPFFPNILIWIQNNIHLQIYQYFTLNNREIGIDALNKINIVKY